MLVARNIIVAISVASTLSTVAYFQDFSEPLFSQEVSFSSFSYASSLCPPILNDVQKPAKSFHLLWTEL
jgi:hypothetical protein